MAAADLHRVCNPPAQTVRALLRISIEMAAFLVLFSIEKAAVSLRTAAPRVETTDDAYANSSLSLSGLQLLCVSD